MKPNLRIAVDALKRHAKFGSEMKHRALMRMSMPSVRMQRDRPKRRVVGLMMRRRVASLKTRANSVTQSQQLFNIDKALHMHWHLSVNHTTMRSTPSAQGLANNEARRPASSHSRHSRSMLHSRAELTRTSVADVGMLRQRRFNFREERSVEVAVAPAAPNFFAITATSFTGKTTSHVACPLAKREKASLDRTDIRLASRRSIKVSVKGNDSPDLARVAAQRYAPVSLQARPAAGHASKRQDLAATLGSSPRAPRMEDLVSSPRVPGTEDLVSPRAPRMDLVWRKPVAENTADTRPSPHDAESRAASTSHVDRSTFANLSESVPRIDAAATERLADEVLRRVERQLRIERERRGL